ncbi:extracellular solute-binding protein [Antarcticirhabdus aurantiaca]|uniref:Extracellular solute-binding protein n=1 Tax=Antarcticirhabdus aurantiaca TaxID=2606717 RepID=A0ACD4NRM4_9HYPH|nr:extracellular solute-binding protein [Antarcticirhabdus aurantiaca]WAJ29357.1 extracellular solute-binding protein [Jeongeuplla avenae]
MGDIKTTRRSAIKLLGASAAGLLAAPAILRSRSAFAQSNVLNITTYDKFIPADFLEKFQADTGITVNIRLTDDQGKQYNLLTAEGANPSTDIVTVVGHRFSQFIGSNLLAPLDTARIASWNSLIPAYQQADWLTTDGKTWGLPILAGFECLARNTDYVEDTGSWDVMFADANKSATSYIVSDFLSITMRYLGDDGDYVTYVDKPDVAQAATNKARDFLIQHKDKVRKYYDAGSEIQQMFINEDVYVAQGWSGPISKLIMDGHPIAISVPKEGTYGFVYTLNVVNNAPNADNAYKFIEAVAASPEVGAAMTRQSGFTSTFAGVEAILDEKERAASTLPADQVERITFFSSVNRDMKNEMVDRASAEIKAA